jgi:hypothetical protein
MSPTCGDILVRLVVEHAFSSHYVQPCHLSSSLAIEIYDDSCWMYRKKKMVIWNDGRGLESCLGILFVFGHEVLCFSVQIDCDWVPWSVMDLK